jgi:predicted nucleic acid-binding protein
MIPKRLVLDTNVCLDLFVFRDPRWTRLADALQAAAVTAVTREDCRREWQIVLGYPHLPLDDESRCRAAADYDALIHCKPIELQPSVPAAALPLCKDPDDQKFLEAARDLHAEALITKDKALLKLARRTARAGLFAILAPEALIGAMEQDEPVQEKNSNAR